MTIAVLALTIAATLAAYMGLWRGIWFDELLHFAVGGMSFEYVIKTIDYTTFNVNHGQTGAYILIDWLILKVTGASAIALRLPSLFSAAVLLGSAVAFLRAKGFGWRWQLVAVLALGANETLMFYTGEARPYMPLAASAAAMLAFYALTPSDRRTWWARLLALFGFLLGALLHPYWVLMAGAVAGFSLTDRLAFDPNSRSLMRAWRFLAPAYLIPALVLYVAIGAMTWMREVFSFGLDRSKIYDWPSLASAFIQDHFSFVPYLYEYKAHAHPVNAGIGVPIVASGLLLVTLVWAVVDRRCRTRRLLSPTLLFLVGGITSLVAAAASYKEEYYIFERQWVAGMALTALALTWFYAEWWRQTGSNMTVHAVPAVAFAVLVAISFTVSMYSQTVLTVERARTWQAVDLEKRTIGELTGNRGGETFLYEPRQGFEYLADVNIARGGPVWDVFIRWYNQQSGMRQEYRERDSNWTDLIWPEPADESFLCLAESQDCPKT